MTLPKNTVPLLDAVVTALTKERGGVRALPADKLFEFGAPSDATTLRNKPMVWVSVRDHRVNSTEPTMHSRLDMDVTVVIDTYYWAGSEVSYKEMLAQLKRVEESRALLFAALTYPGALATDSEGRDTGVAGHSLRADANRYRCVGPDLIPNGTQRLLRLTHQFTASVELLQPT